MHTRSNKAETQVAWCKLAMKSDFRSFWERTIQKDCCVIRKKTKNKQAICNTASIVL